MKTPNVSSLKRYASSIRKFKSSEVTVEDLAKKINVYPEVITNCLSYFEPMLMMDLSFNLKELLPQMEKFIEESSVNNEAVSPVYKLDKEELKKYASINDFVFKKLTVNGQVNMEAYLSDKDLVSLSELIKKEQKRRKN